MLTGGIVLRICRDGVKGVLALSRARSSGVIPLGSDPMLSGPMKLDAMAGDPSLAQRAACEPAPSCTPNAHEDILHDRPQLKEALMHYLPQTGASNSSDMQHKMHPENAVLCSTEASVMKGRTDAPVCLLPSLETRDV